MTGLGERLRESLEDVFDAAGLEFEEFVQGPAVALAVLGALLISSCASVAHAQKAFVHARHAVQQAERVGLEMAEQSARRSAHRVCMLSR